VPTATTTEKPRPGRPSTGARERILDGAFEVLKRDGYAGLTTAKVAAESGQNKGLIAYHFGSKQGLVAAVAHDVSATVIDEVVSEVGEPSSADQLVRGLTAGVWRVMDRDPGLQRVYFDLASQSVVEPQVKEIMSDMKVSFRAILGELLRAVDDGPRGAEVDAAAVFLIAGIEGLSMERLDRGETPELIRARRIFESSAAEAIRY
jgi:TetR/AcrR family acrAB operon transcriptional repressor